MVFSQLMIALVASLLALGCSTTDRDKSSVSEDKSPQEELFSLKEKQVLVRSFIDDFHSDLAEASAFKDSNYIEALKTATMEFDSDLWKQSVKAQNSAGETALMVASFRGDDRLVKLLLTDGADAIDKQDASKRSALVYSLFGKYLSINAFQWSANGKSGEGKSILQRVKEISDRYDAVTQTLIQAKANASLKDIKGLTYTDYKKIEAVNRAGDLRVPLKTAGPSEPSLFQPYALIFSVVQGGANLKDSRNHLPQREGKPYYKSDLEKEETARLLKLAPAGYSVRLWEGIEGLGKIEVIENL